jgi:hypothetical protein
MTDWNVPLVTIRFKPLPLDPADATWKVALVVALCWGSFVVGLWTGGR